MNEPDMRKIHRQAVHSLSGWIASGAPSTVAVEQVQRLYDVTKEILEAWGYEADRLPERNIGQEPLGV